MSAILKFDLKKKRKKETITFFWSKLSKLHKKDPTLHVTTTFSLKQGETRTSSGPISPPLNCLARDGVVHRKSNNKFARTFALFIPLILSLSASVNNPLSNRNIPFAQFSSSKFYHVSFLPRALLCVIFLTLSHLLHNVSFLAILCWTNPHRLCFNACPNNDSLPVAISVSQEVERFPTSLSRFSLNILLLSSTSL